MTADFLRDVPSVDAVRRQFIDGPLQASEPAALEIAAELFALLRTLPDAFAASQRRELGRLLRTSDAKDARVMALQASIEQADALRATAQLGQVRLERAMGTLIGGVTGFHGFVSDGNLAPLPKLTVRLTASAQGKGKTFSGTTQADGFFSIELEKTTRDSGAKRGPTSMIDRLAAVFAGGGADAHLAAARPDETGEGRVEILKGGTVIYSDPVPVVLGEGSVYREYVIATGEAPPAHSGTLDLRDTPPDRPGGPPPRPTPPRGGESRAPKTKK